VAGICLLLLSMSGAGNSTSDQGMPERDWTPRLAAAFDETGQASANAAIKAAAWARFRGNLFPAAVCVQAQPPRMACGELAEARRLAVASIPIEEKADALAGFNDTSRLEGNWRGDGLRLQIDAERAQANIDAAAPFEWKRFVVSRATERSVVFVLGADVFHAELSDGSLLLTSTAFRGEREMLRY
jgi:hypothetical protein